MRIAGVYLREAVRQTDKIYTYKVPESMINQVVPGSYVRVPFGFGNKTQIALVATVSDDDSNLGFDSKKLKSVESMIDLYPVMKNDQLALIEPLKQQLLATSGDIISMMLPSLIGTASRAKANFVSIEDINLVQDILKSNGLRSINHIHILEFLLEQGEIEKKQLLTITKTTDAQLRSLRDKGLIRITNRLLTREESEAAEPDANCSEHKDTFRVVHTLNDEQNNAYEEVKNSLGKPQVFLLNGITGSGKTEVYLKCAGEVLDRRGSVIYLVPEISLTPQTVSWLRGRFGDVVAVMHSRLTDKQRFLEWDRIRRGEARIVVGARSSIFAPVDNLQLIIIDEEHDSSYKAENFPKYNARDIAFLRMTKNSCPLILGSATPLVTSYYAANKNAFKLLKLKHRANPDAVLPEVKIIDMKNQVMEGYGNLISGPLRAAMAEAFSQNKQVILFLNRRGYSRSLFCNDCGEAVSCPNCSVGMTLHNNRHSSERLLICHYCGFTIPTSMAKCSNCESKKFRKAGVGTQQLEEILHELYPKEKVLRMDQDTTMGQGSHEEILTKFRNQEASILVGTQMIAKGHDFPNVTVVGVLGADLIALSSDYKSSERAFELITQSAGRAGRAGQKGKVYLQSMHPDNPLLRYAAKQDYEAFYDTEISYREAMRLPPFKAVGEIVLSLPDENDLALRIRDVDKYVREFVSYQDPKYGFEVYGPTPSPIYELRGRYRYVLIVKANKKAYLNAVFRQMMDDFDSNYYPLSFDNDAGGN